MMLQDNFKFNYLTTKQSEFWNSNYRVNYSYQKHMTLKRVACNFFPWNKAGGF